MLNRRNFLSLSALTAGAATFAEAQSDDEKCGVLPAPIAALKSRKSEAKPITVEERTQRMVQARDLMGRNGLDAVFMIGGTSMVYFTGVKWWNSERLGAAVIPAKGQAFWVCPVFEEARLREQVAATCPEGANAKVLTWNEDEDPYRVVAQGLRDAGITTGALGMEERTTYVFVEGVGKAAPQMKITSATPVAAGCRMIKSDHELQLMTLANQVTLQAYEAAWKSLKPGMTQHEFAHLVSAAHTQLGFEGGAGVQVGENSALPHGSLKPQKVEEGTILLMDGGCAVEGYESDISRTFVLGKPTDKMRKVFDIVHEAQATALKTARPGIAAQEVDRAARKVVTDAGYGPAYKHFGHRVGHGIGMDGHEWPYLVGGDAVKLAPRMCFSDEPGIYLSGEFGVRLEDDMHITEDGAQLFTPQSKSLEEPFVAG
ncbi:MAG: metallopeptidase MdpA [Acidobacteriaceae bacterium]